MATEDLTLRMRAQGARQAARDVDRATGSVRGLEKQSRKSSKTVRALGTGIGVMGTLGVGAFAAVGAEVYQATKGWAEHQGVVRRTNAVIRSTSQAAGVSAKHVENLSDSLERQTGIDGDLIQRGANMLLTFTNIRNEAGKGNKIFDQATNTLTGMSQALGQDASKTAIQLGKALNDPIKGITALSRVGVTFTKGQKDQIKSLVESGKRMEAQKIILKELNKEFPKVKATPWERMLVTFRQLEDTVGKAVLPIFNKFVNYVQPRLQHVANTVASVFGNKNLNWQQRLQAIGRSIRHWFGPIGHQASEALKHAFRAAGPIAARAFIAGFKAAPAWAKFLTAVWLAVKLAPAFKALGGMMCGKFTPSFLKCAGGKLAGAGPTLAPAGTAIGEAVGMSAASAISAALAGIVIPAGLAAVLGNYGPFKGTQHKAQPVMGGRAPTQGPEARRRSKYMPKAAGPGSVVTAEDYGRGMVAANTAASRGYQGIPQPMVVHSHVHLDGKEVAKSTARHATKAKSTR